MRISTNRKDPGFVEDGPQWVVKFNGKKPPKEWLIITADEDQGFVSFNRLAPGSLMPEIEVVGAIVRMVVFTEYGVVRINRVYDAAPQWLGRRTPLASSWDRWR